MINVCTVYTHIVVKLQFEGWHCWPGAPEEHSYLRSSHRHVFHVEAKKQVSHENRAIEFIEFKRKLEAYCRRLFTASQANPHALSCEAMAMDLLLSFELSSCTVLEDNENGGEVILLQS